MMLICSILFLLTLSGDLPAQNADSKFITENFKKEIPLEYSKIIDEVITMLAHKSLSTIFFSYKDLKKAGKALEGKISSLEFLGYIFSRDKTIREMAKIKKSRAKYDGFVKSLNGSMETLMNSPYFEDHLIGFIRYLGLKEDVTRKILCDNMRSKGKFKFKAFLDYLLQSKAHF